jgi:hypothetical protein
VTPDHDADRSTVQKQETTVTTNPRQIWAAAIMAVILVGLAPVRAQINSTFTDQDRAEIQKMWTTYRSALFGCRGEAYADLFATPGGYFGSSSRGEVRERQALIEMVMGYDRCHPEKGPAPSAAQTADPAATSNFPSPQLEPAPEGAKARIINSKGGGYYDDVYVKTPKGWRFKSRNVVSDGEVAAHLTTADFVEIRQLAGDDHGHYDDLYGDHEGHISPRGLVPGPDTRPFRTSGLRLTPTPEGVRGLAYLRDNGGHYEDLYVKTAQGWRIKERVYVPPAKAKSKA